MKTYRPNHVAISVRDLDASLAFYRAFGLREINRTTFDDGQATLVHLQLDEFALEVFAYEKNRNLPPLDLPFANGLDSIGVKHFAFATDDIHATLQDLRARGLADSAVTVDGLPDGRAHWLFLRDPDGMWVEVIQENRFSLYERDWPSVQVSSQ
jgi:catechol 2,3-dioxygenase-like lactoylglutathione lyase family enzyme